MSDTNKTFDASAFEQHLIQLTMNIPPEAGAIIRQEAVDLLDLDDKALLIEHRKRKFDILLADIGSNIR